MASRTGELSGVAVYRWRVDRRAPSIRWLFPAERGFYDEHAWEAGCGGAPAVCGQANDPSGVRWVEASVRQAGGLWWSGRSFSSRREVFLPVRGARSWHLPLRAPMVAGLYVVRVRAADRLGNVTGGRDYAIRMFTILPPPVPLITLRARTGDPSHPSFSFSDSEPGVRLSCELDSGGWRACSSPIVYGGLGVGAHKFFVAATDGADNVSVGQLAFAVSRSAGVPFSISGDVPDVLYPGIAAAPIAVTLSNPNNASIQVTSLAASLDPSSLPAGCQASWFEITQADVSVSRAVSVPAHGSVMLPAQGASAPMIQMIDSGTDQDACRGAHLTISYRGDAHS